MICTCELTASRSIGSSYSCVRSVEDNEILGILPTRKTDENVDRVEEFVL
jgi:hypothetical protein